MTPKGKGKDQEPFLKDSTKQTETIPSASSSGSCVMSDIGSVGSNSTKTRFSFYNAQEVAQKKDPSTTTCNEQQQQQQQQQQTQDDSNDTNENKSNKSDNETSFCSNNRFNFYNANEVNGTISISSTRNHNHNNSNTTVPQSTEETVTLASAVAVAAAASRENDKIINKDGAQDKDDRRSPQTPQFHDDDDVTNGTPRIPAANSTTANAATTAAAAYTAAIKSTPQRSNSTCFKTDDGTAVSPSDQAAEQEAVIATDDPVSSIVKRVSDEAPHEYNDDQTSAHVSTTTTDNNDTNMNSVDILRSLQDTEHMRNVTKQCDAMSQEGGVVYRATTASASDEEEESDKETNEHFSNQEDCTSQEDTSQEIYENADTFDSDDVHNLQLRNLQEQVRKLEMVKKSSAERELVTSSKAMPTGTGAGVGTSHHHLSSPGTFQEYHNSLQRPASTIAPPPLPSVAGATTTTTAVEEEANSAAASINPYESAIREALDLLRKHRPPSPYYPPLATQDTGVTSMAVVQEEIDTSTTAHHQHDPEELSARRKERQERMARYSSRLAELKNSGEDGCPVSNNNSNADLATMSSTAAQSETIQRPFVQNLQPDQQSLAGQNDDLSSVPPAHNALPASTCDVPASFYSVDVASIGASSSLSVAPFAVPATTANPKEVHRNVERVLLAILERANSNGRAVQSTSNSATAMDSPATSLHGSIHTTGVSTRSEDSIVYQRVSEEKKSPDPRSNSSGTHPDVAENPLLLAVGELLSAGRVHSVDSRVSGVASPARRSVTTDRSNTTTGTRRSVVEELLAEAESFGTEQQVSTSTMQTGIQTAPAGKQPAVSERHAQGSAKVSKRAAKSDADAHSVVVDKELDELVLKTLGKPNCKRNLSHDNESTESDQEETGEYTEDRESQSRTCTSYDDDDDDLEDNYNGDSQEIDDDDLDDALEGVLGPLSGNAGESTGVVLEANLSPRSNSDGESIFNSLSNAMSSLVASAMSSEEKKSLLAGQFTKCSARDKYATDMDNAENDGNEGSRSGEEDDEANELMRSLCAHLLPFGVDQSTRFLDEVPHWDDENPNEAGYRIIRLTSQQLLRVEHAFESMVSKFKKDSENELIGGGTNANTIDESFERDLAVAEQVLDGDVEADRTSAIMKALKLIPKGPSGKARDATDSGDESDTDTSDHDSVSEQADISHPDFPGIHSAGKGEMGDLEYFSLPIIFKSHVTGFEPTKDLFLEPGNVVAGQYLVESELGSAAFSTAYRCVDLNSEGDDTEDVSFCYCDLGSSIDSFTFVQRFLFHFRSVDNRDIKKYV